MLHAAQIIRRPASTHFVSITRRLSSTFGLNDMQQSIKATAAAFANSDLAPKAAAVDRNHSFPKEAVHRMGEMGFMGIPVPEQCVCPPCRPHTLPHALLVILILLLLLPLLLLLSPLFPHRYGGAGLDNVS